MSQSEIGRFNELVDDEKIMEAIEFAINTDEWASEKYALISDETIILSNVDWLQILDDIEAEAERIGAEITTRDREDLQALKDFSSRASSRSNTMIHNITELVSAYPDAPVGFIIGAAHTELITHHLTESAISFAVVRPESLVERDETSRLSNEAYERKKLRLSVDTIGGLGILLDGRRKPPPVLDTVWFRSKAETYFLTALIARADSRDHPLLSTQLSNKLAQMQYVMLMPDSFHTLGDEKVFAVRAQVENLTRPLEIWVRTTSIRSTSLITLESALENVLSNFGSSDLELSEDEPPLHITADILAIFSTDQIVVENTPLVR